MNTVKIRACFNTCNSPKKTSNSDIKQLHKHSLNRTGDLIIIIFKENNKEVKDWSEQEKGKVKQEYSDLL